MIQIFKKINKRFKNGNLEQAIDLFSNWKMLKNSNRWYCITRQILRKSSDTPMNNDNVAIRNQTKEIFKTWISLNQNSLLTSHQSTLIKSKSRFLAVVDFDEKFFRFDEKLLDMKRHIVFSMKKLAAVAVKMKILINTFCCWFWLV